MPRNSTTKIITLVLLAMSLTAACMQGESHRLPDKIDSKARYVFFLHGHIIEDRGPNVVHPRYGAYRYYDLIAAFESHGFIVISEVRPHGTDVQAYAQKVAGQVRTLLDAGVAPKRITVCGHSKGGLITLYTAAELRNPKINYVSLAGCGKKGTDFFPGYKRFLDKEAANARGRFLSVVDIAADDISGSCSKIEKFKGVREFKELDLNTGKGHGLFYRPDSRWVTPVVEWIKATD